MTARKSIWGNTMQLDKTISAIVTGGASGLGAATARALAAKGARVAVFDLDEANGTKVAGEIGGQFVRCDVTDEASIDAALAKARAAHGQERILVNCAGIAIGKRTVRRVRDTGAIEPHDTASFRKRHQRQPHRHLHHDRQEHRRHDDGRRPSARR